MMKTKIALKTILLGILYFPATAFNSTLSVAPAAPAASDTILAETSGTATPTTEGKVIKVKQNGNNGYRIKTVVIDAGHGGHDPGCLGGSSQEKHLALAIAQNLSGFLSLRYPDIRVIMTRNADVFIPLHERATIANRNDADLFISIHCNFMPNSVRTHGSETYVMGLHTAEHNLDVAKRENDVILLEDNYEKNYDYDPNSPEGHIMLSMFQNAYLEQSILFAEKVEEKIHSEANRRSRGVKQAGFVVLKETTMPSVLIESGFLSNPDEEQYLKTPEGQQHMAEAILAAFAEYKSLVEGTDELASDMPAPAIETAKAAPTPSSLPKIQPGKETANPRLQDPVASTQADRSAAILPQPPDKTKDDTAPSPYSPGDPFVSGNSDIGTPIQSQSASEKEKQPEPPKTTPEASSEFAAYRIADPPSASAKATSGPSTGFGTDVTSYSAGNRTNANPKYPADNPAQPNPVGKAIPIAEMPASGLITFSVQLAASPAPLNTTSSLWLNLDYPVEVLKEDGLFTYQARNFNNLHEAMDARIKIRSKGFTEAFIVAYKGMERIPLEQAKTELGQ